MSLTARTSTANVEEVKLGESTFDSVEAGLDSLDSDDAEEEISPTLTSVLVIVEVLEGILIV